jgi:hypothetical protein
MAAAGRNRRSRPSLPLEEGPLEEGPLEEGPLGRAEP